MHACFCVKLLHIDPFVQPFGKGQNSNYEGMKVKQILEKCKRGTSAIATSFWKIERAVWSSGNIPFTVLTSFNFKVVIAERVTMESQKKNLVNLAAGNIAQHTQSYLSN